MDFDECFIHENLLSERLLWVEFPFGFAGLDSTGIYKLNNVGYLVKKLH